MDSSAARLLVNPIEQQANAVMLCASIAILQAERDNTDLHSTC